MNVKEFCTTAECREYALAIAKEHNMQITFQYYMDNLSEVKTPALQKLVDGSLKPIHTFDGYQFGLAPTDKRRVAGELPFRDELVFYAKRKGVSLLYKFKMAPISENHAEEIHMCIVRKSGLFKRLLEITIQNNLGIVGASINVKQQDGTWKSKMVEDLSKLPDFDFQLKSDDAKRAVDKLELNYYIIDNEGYLNLKLARKSNGAV